MILSSEIAGRTITMSINKSSTLETFDNTKLTAVNVCPTWGITRYGMHKVMPRKYENARAMALEMGQAAHDAFAAIRLATLYRSHPDHATWHCTRIFGADRSANLSAIMSKLAYDERSTMLRHIALEAVATSGFTDDLFDRRRTISNLEAAIVAYAGGYDYTRWHVWCGSDSDPTAAIGVEQSYSMLMNVVDITQECDTIVRLTGKIDGLMYNHSRTGELLVVDNKTAGRIDDTWQRGWDMSHQISGYCVAGGLIAGLDSPINRSVIAGLQIPLPKMIIEGIRDTWLTRQSYHIDRWVAWVVHTVALYNQYKDDPINAPKYSHSCTRYFRPCSMIPFCMADREEQDVILTEMEHDEWTPLAEEYDG